MTWTDDGLVEARRRQTNPSGGGGCSLERRAQSAYFSRMEQASGSQAPIERESVLKQSLRWLQGPAAIGTITAAFSQILLGYVVSIRPKAEQWNVDPIVMILALGAFAIAAYIEWHRPVGARKFD